MKHRLLRALALVGLVCCLIGPVAAEEWDWGAADGNGAAQTVYFSDVTAEDWYYEVVMQLVNSGTINGFPDGTFRPKSTVTTGQALKMILLASGYPEPENVASHWARGYLDLAIAEGFVTRFQEITDLDVSITRGLVAQIAARAMGLQRPETLVSPFTDTDSDEIVALAAIGIVDGYTDGSFQPNKSLTRAELSAITARIVNYLAPGLSTEPSTGLDSQDPITLRTTENGVAFIKAREGFQAKAYWDYSQYSIGYGSRCEADEYPDGITQEQADRLLQLKLQEFEAKLDAFLEKNSLTLSDAQYDALISLTYNIGSTWMSSSRLAQYLAAGNYTHNELASAFGIWCHVTDKSGTAIHEGLIARRILELKLFLYGDYTGSSAAGFNYVKFTTQTGTLEVDIAFYETGSTFTPYFKASSTGDTFLGWFTEDGTEVREGDIITQNLTLTARWAGQSTGTPDNVVDLGDGWVWTGESWVYTGESTDTGIGTDFNFWSPG